jgi:hypothetical protein
MGQTGQGQNVHEFMDVQRYVFPETRFPQDVGQEQPEGGIRRLYCIRRTFTNQDQDKKIC